MHESRSAYPAHLIGMKRRETRDSEKHARHVTGGNLASIEAS